VNHFGAKPGAAAGSTSGCRTSARQSKFIIAALLGLRVLWCATSALGGGDHGLALDGAAQVCHPSNTCPTPPSAISDRRTRSCRAPYVVFHGKPEPSSTVVLLIACQESQFRRAASPALRCTPTLEEVVGRSESCSMPLRGWEHCRRRRARILSSLVGSAT